jgi:hypothetical protein
VTRVCIRVEEGEKRNTWKMGNRVNLLVSAPLVIFRRISPSFEMSRESLPSKVARLHYGNNSPCVTLRHSHRGGAPALKYAAARPAFNR